MQTRSRWREVFLQPDSDHAPVKPTREQLRALPRSDRRRARLAYQTHGGVFRTWVYLVVLIALVGGFVLYLSAVG